MILKEKDSIEVQLKEMELALAKPLPNRERQRLEKDLAICRAGLQGEKEAAYHIDFDLKNSRNWAVIHDLRLEWNGRVAQIDHLLIDRLLEIYVIESKSFRSKVRYANGGWERINFNHWEGIPSPVEQNERHIAVLRELITDKRLAPTRLGLSLRPSFFNVVVVMPSCSIVGKYPEDVCIWRMDTLVKKVLHADVAVLDILKCVSPEALYDFGACLAACHAPAVRPKTTPAPVIAAPSTPQNFSTQATRLCQVCGKPLSTAETDYCRANASRFTGHLLCRKCQTNVPAIVKSSAKPAAPQSLDAEITARCAICGIGVDKKVLAFCRFNSKRFAGRTLCRRCQSSA